VNSGVFRPEAAASTTSPRSLRKFLDHPEPVEVSLFRVMQDVHPDESSKQVLMFHCCTRGLLAPASLRQSEPKQ
jgi:hypothetical protein